MVMDFLDMIQAFFDIQSKFPGSAFDVVGDQIIATLSVGETNAELFRQGQQMFSD
jgi:hypothetical protein